MNSVVCVRVCAPGVLRADGAHPRISRLALHRRKLAQREEANGPGTTLLALPTSLHLIRVWSDGRSSSSDSSGEPCGDKKRRRSRRSKRNHHCSDDHRDADQPSQPLSTSTDEPSQPLIVLVLAKDVLGRVHLEIQKTICFSSFHCRPSSS